MVALDTLGATELGQVITTFRDGLRSHQELINRLNVYPVPDGDTGTNMALTMASVTDELDALDAPDLGAACKAIAHGSLMGARGNSGVILSQLLRGIAEGLAGSVGSVGPPGPRALSEALTMADQLAREAVMRPVEGTILTVARGAAEGARSAADKGESLVSVAEAARAGAADALARTPSLLPVLAQAGVVDAGGTGYLLLFDALLSVIDGRAMPSPPDLPGQEFSPGNPEAPGTAPPRIDTDGEENLAGLRYEVMYLLEAPDATIPSFKEVWAGIGDSIVVVGGDGLWNCHIHTDDIGAAIEASLDAGRPRNVRVTDLLEQVEEERWVREAAATAGSGPSETPSGPPRATGVVAVATGDGVGRIFRSLGVQQSHRRRPVHEPLHGRPGRSGRGGALGSRDHPAQQRQHPSRGRAGGGSDRQIGLGGAHRHHHRGIRRPPGLRSRSRGGCERPGDGGVGGQGGSGRGDQGRA